MRYPIMGRWVDSETEEVLLENLYQAESYHQRLLGLQFSARLSVDAGLFLHGVRSVHTFCMRFSIDLFFLDEELRIVDCRRNVRPWRIDITKNSTARHVIETATGSLANVTEGMRTKIVPVLLDEDTPK